MRKVLPNPRHWKATVLVGLQLIPLAGYATAQPTPDGYANLALLVTISQVANHLPDNTWRLVDVREPEQYAAGHIPGAVNLPVSLITQANNGTPGMLAPLVVLTQALGDRGITRENQVVIYDNISSTTAARLFWALDYLGHPGVSLLQGGLEAWRQAGRPLSQKPPRFQPTTYQATPDASKVATLGWLVTHFREPNVVLLDARSTAEFIGQVPGRQVKRPGHIPGAVNVDWVQNLTAPPRQIRSGSDLLRLYQQAGVTPDKEIVVYCRTGTRASHTYFALRLLGYPRVRLYDGSYVEWAATPSVPVAR